MLSHISGIPANILILRFFLYHVQPPHCRNYYQSTPLLFSVMPGTGLSENNPMAHSSFTGRLSYQDSFSKQKRCSQARFFLESVSFSPFQGKGPQLPMAPVLCLRDAWISQAAPGNSCTQSWIAFHHNDICIFKLDLQIEKGIVYGYVMSF